MRKHQTNQAEVHSTKHLCPVTLQCVEVLNVTERLRDCPTLQTKGTRQRNAIVTLDSVSGIRRLLGHNVSRSFFWAFESCSIIVEKDVPVGESPPKIFLVVGRGRGVGDKAISTGNFPFSGSGGKIIKLCLPVFFKFEIILKSEDQILLKIFPLLQVKPRTTEDVTRTIVYSLKDICSWWFTTFCKIKSFFFCHKNIAPTCMTHLQSEKQGLCLPRWGDKGEVVRRRQWWGTSAVLAVSASWSRGWSLGVYPLRIPSRRTHTICALFWMHAALQSHLKIHSPCS